MPALQIRPIDVWPGALKSWRKSSQFKSTWDKTLALLDRELTNLKASSYLLQMAVSESDIGIHGQLKAGARLKHPGVILCVDTPHGALQMPCDTYGDWRENVRAIALSLEALRAVNRYGVSQHAEQYRGWMKLAPPDGFNSPGTAREWLASLLTLDITALGTRESVERAIRQAEMKTHPDRGGDPRAFHKVQKARELLLR